MSDPRADLPSDPDLDRVVEAIANDQAVDWELETSQRPDLLPLLGPLQVAASVSAYHRDLPPAEEPLPIESGPDIAQWGPLKVLEKIGHGGASDVYRAFDPSLQVEVALKLLRSASASDRRLIEEARRLARVRHPNVLVVHGADVHDGRAGIWSDRIVGSTFEQLLSTHGPYGAAECIQIGIDLCGALAAVHRAGIVHRDIKTTNVMREHGGRLVLMDFGAGSDREGASSPFQEEGTPLFMAPEQIAGKPATPASDMYSLGVLLFRLATGRFPVEARSFAELQAQHDRGERHSLRSLRPDLPAAFVAVVERALEPAPEFRFADAASFERALVNASVGFGSVQDYGKKRDARWGFVGAIALLAVGFWFAWSARRPGPSEGMRTPPAPSPLGSPTVQPAPSPAGNSGSVQAMVPRVVLRRERDGRVLDLAPGDSVRTGDALSLEIETRGRLHVYVLDQDEEGKVFVLFPVSGTDLENPLREGYHRLPGRVAGKNVSWQITSAGGKETVTVVAAPAPITVLERELEQVPRLDFDTERGIGRIVESQTPPEVDRLDQILNGLRSPSLDAPWIWQIRLRNP